MRQRSQLVKVASNSRTKGADGRGRSDGVFYEAIRPDVSVVELRETTRAEPAGCTTVVLRVFCCGNESGGQHGVGLVVKNWILNNATYNAEYVDGCLMAMWFASWSHGGAVNSLAAYGPTEVPQGKTKQAFWNGLDSFVQQIPSRECAYFLMDAEARTGRRIG